MVNACGTSAPAAPVDRCHDGADAVLLAVPGRNAGDLSSKVLIDANNPIGDDMMPFTRASESLAGIIANATGARVVKAFNTIGMGNVVNPEFGDQNSAGFVCGDDGDAKSLTLGLANEPGYEADLGLCPQSGNIGVRPPHQMGCKRPGEACRIL